MSLTSLFYNAQESEKDGLDNKELVLSGFGYWFQSLADIPDPERVSRKSMKCKNIHNDHNYLTIP